MWLFDSNPGHLKTNPEKEMGRTARNPEATKVSDEEYHEAGCSLYRKSSNAQVCKSHESDINWYTAPGT